MAISLSLIHKARWRERAIDRNHEALLDMVRPFTLESLYPSLEEEDEYGNLVEVRKILPHQMLIHRPPTFIVKGKEKEPYALLHSGGFGSGKSINMTVQVVYLARRYPGIRIVVIAPYDYYFLEFIWPTFETVFPFDGNPLIRKMNMKERMIWLANGSTIRFKAYDDSTKVKGWNAHILWIEEASELGGGDPHKALSIFNALQGRHRAAGNYPRQIYISQNPKGHNWVWKLFIKDSKDRDAPKITWVVRPRGHPDCLEGDDPLKPEGVCYKEYVHTTSEGEVLYTVTSGSNNNLTLPTGYIERMTGFYDAETARRFIAGDFNPINTLIYEWPVYSPDTHVIERSAFLEFWDLLDSERPEIPSYWPVIVGIDVGGSISPWAVQFYVETPSDDFGVTHFVCFDELYMRKVTDWKQVAEAILAKTEAFENVRYFIDPKSGPKKEGPNQTSIIDNFADNDLHVEIAKGYNKAGGILNVKSLLARDMTRPCPYKEDVPDGLEHKDGIVRYNRGCARLYYLRDNDWIITDEEYRDEHAAGIKTAFPNPHGYACPANLAEKEVWRNDTKKQREQKESEEGLSAKVQEKPVDSDDHAQTAEIFAVIGWNPPPPPRSTKKRVAGPEGGPQSRYPINMRRPGG